MPVPQAILPDNEAPDFSLGWVRHARWPSSGLKVVVGSYQVTLSQESICMSDCTYADYRGEHKN